MLQYSSGEGVLFCGAQAATAHVTIFIGKLLSFLAKQKNELALCVPACRYRIHLVTQSASFFRFSVGLRMFPDLNIVHVP